MLLLHHICNRVFKILFFPYSLNDLLQFVLIFHCSADGFLKCFRSLYQVFSFNFLDLIRTQICKTLQPVEMLDKTRFAFCNFCNVWVAMRFYFCVNSFQLLSIVSYFFCHRDCRLFKLFKLHL